MSSSDTSHKHHQPPHAQKFVRSTEPHMAYMTAFNFSDGDYVRNEPDAGMIYDSDHHSISSHYEDDSDRDGDDDNDDDDSIDSSRGQHGDDDDDDDDDPTDTKPLLPPTDDHGNGIHIPSSLSGGSQSLPSSMAAASKLSTSRHSTQPLLKPSIHGHKISPTLPPTAGSSKSSAAVIHNYTSNIIMLACIFAISLGGLLLLYLSMPNFAPEDRPFITLPRSFDDVKKLSQIIDKYKDEHFFYVLSLFAAMYITLQAFAIPGAVFLSILAGPLYGVLPGMIIISTVATIGSSLCFLLSRTLGAPLINYFFPQQLATFREKIEENRDGLFFYMLFLRVAPVLPNWLITIASPILHVDYIIFACATFFGVMPNNYIMTTVGLSLQSVTDPGPLLTPKSFLTLTFIGAIALFPLWLKNKMSNKKNHPMTNAVSNDIAHKPILPSSSSSLPASTIGRPRRMSSVDRESD